MCIVKCMLPSALALLFYYGVEWLGAFKIIERCPTPYQASQAKHTHMAYGYSCRCCDMCA